MNFKKKIIPLIALFAASGCMSSCKGPLDPLKDSSSSSLPYSYNEDDLQDAPCSFLSRTITYNGTFINTTISDYTSNNSDVIVSYQTTDLATNVTVDGNGATDVGEYNVTATFKSKMTNLKVYKDISAHLSIVQADYPYQDEDIQLDSNGVYTYDGQEHSLIVTSSRILSEFEVSYDETFQNQKEVGTYVVKTTFVSKSKNYKTFTRQLFYKIKGTTTAYWINLIDPFEEKEDCIYSLGNIAVDKSLKEFFEENPDKKKAVDSILEVESVKYPYAHFAWSYDEDAKVSPADAKLIATAKTYNVNLIFPEGSGVVKISGAETYTPFISYKKTRTINNAELGYVDFNLEYDGLMPSDTTFDLLDCELSLNGKTIVGYYLDEDYKTPLPTLELTPSMFDPSSDSYLNFSDSVIKIYVNVQ